ncbi:MAG TPA: choice-of-anchor Q domain-containing protein [Mycobacteriales bacterium]|nr:choice-of-anchor Q domain-containing protein [Mycobacteriales bacterium]
MRAWSLSQRGTSAVAAIAAATSGLVVGGWAVGPAKALAAGSTYYASPNGEGDCTSKPQACLLSTAVGKTVDGDTILLEAGTYTITDQKITTSITIKPDTGAAPVFDADDDLVVLEIGDAAGESSPSVVVQGIKFQDYGGVGVDCRQNASLTVKTSTFTTRPYAVGIGTETGDVTDCLKLEVDDSTFFESDNGIGIRNGSNPSASVTVAGSTFTTTSDQGDAATYGILNAYVGNMTVGTSTFETEAQSASSLVAGIANQETGKVTVNHSTFDTTLDSAADGSFAFGIDGFNDGPIAVHDSSFDTSVTPGSIGSTSLGAGIETCDADCGPTEGPALTVDGSDFQAETETATSDGKPVATTGGSVSGVRSSDRNATISDSTFDAYSEAADSTAYGVDSLANALSIGGSDFDSGVGRAPAGGGRAFGAFSENGTMKVSTSNFDVDGTDPKAALVAGVGSTSTAVVQDSTITAAGNGLGVTSGLPPAVAEASSGDVTVRNSTVVGDGTGASAGVIAVSAWQDSDLTVEQTTLTQAARGVYVDEGQAVLEAVIVAGNAVDCAKSEGSITDAGYNIDSDGSCHFTNPSVSHSATIAGSLAPLADNGGPTKTVGLTPDSPAHNIVAGAATLSSDDSKACANPDQRGVARPGAGHTCDAGAFQGSVGGGGPGPVGGGDTTLVKVDSNDDPSTTDAPVTFTGTLSPTPPCGTVTWLVDNVAQGSPIPVAQGTPGPQNTDSLVFTLGPISNLAVGAHPVALGFSGCGPLGTAQGELIQVVNKPADAGSRPPSIVAHLHSKHHKTKAGWYRNRVKVTFTCIPGSAPLDAAGCPAPVILRHGGKGQSVTGTVHATDGQAASVTVAPINIDRSGPRHLRLHGAHFGTTYSFADRSHLLTCTAQDHLSPVVSCTVLTHRVRHGKFVVVHVTMTATNSAGGHRTKRGSYRYRRSG